MTSETTAALGVAVVAGLFGCLAALVSNARQARHQNRQQAAKEQREDRAQWDRQIAEAITTAMSFLFTIGIVRAGWVETSAFRTNDGRRSALELQGIMGPAIEKMERLIVVGLHRGSDPHIVQCAHELAGRLDDLIGSLHDPGDVFEPQLARAKEALKEFRQAADDRHQEPEPEPGHLRRALARMRYFFGRDSE